MTQYKWWTIVWASWNVCRKIDYPFGLLRWSHWKISNIAQKQKKGDQIGGQTWAVLLLESSKYLYIKWKYVVSIGDNYRPLYQYSCLLLFRQDLFTISTTTEEKSWLSMGGGIQEICYTATILYDFSMLQHLGRKLITRLWPFQRCNDRIKTTS